MTVKKSCPACGREMVLIGSWWECSNRQCDYEEEDSDGEEVTGE